MKIWRRLALVPSLLLTLASPSFGQDVEPRLKALEDTTRAQQEKIEEQQRLIDELKSSPLGGASAPGAAGGAARPAPGEPAQAAAPGQEGTTAKLTGIFGGSAMTNPYLSLIVNTFFYGSNLNQNELDSRTVPGFTNVPVGVNKGFTLESAELFIFAPVDPYFNLYANIPVTERRRGTGGSLFRYFLPARRPAGQGREVQERLRPHQRPASPCVGFRRHPVELSGDDRTRKGGWIRVSRLRTSLLSPCTLNSGWKCCRGRTTCCSIPTEQHPMPLPRSSSVPWISAKIPPFFSGLPSPPARRESPLSPTTPSSRGTPTSSASNLSTSGNRPAAGASFSKANTCTGNRTAISARETRRIRPRRSNPLKRAQDGIYVQGLYQIDRWRIGVAIRRAGPLQEGLRPLRGRSRILGNSPGGRRAPWNSILRSSPAFASSTPGTNLQGTERPTTNCIFQMLLGIGAHAAHSF